jgi:adenine/guanine phosphoribosyltransferase-like PRPP-binding protein
MFGHEHVAGVEKDIENTFIATSGVAIKPIKKKSIENNINIIEIINKKNEITLIPNFFHLKEEKRNKYSPEYGFWNPVESESLSKELPILKKGKSPNKSLSLVPPQVDLHEDKNNSNQKQDNKVKSKKRDYSSELFEAVKKKNIFISGHFHWSDEAKAHNWLIIPKLLEDKEIGALCKKALIDLFLQKIKKTDLIIGIGMEGSFLASNISAKMDIPFSFIPYQFRHKDHDTPELEINHAPVDNLTIIIDVINSGSTIIEMLKKNNNKKFFSKPKKINLLSLFHTGEKSKPSVDLLKKTVDKRIDYYYVCDRFRIHQCPYSKDKNFKKNCVICDEKLEPIYEFYSQNSNISE